MRNLKRVSRKRIARKLRQAKESIRLHFGAAKRAAKYAARGAGLGAS